MLLRHIQGALQDLSDIIKMTEADIEDIKQAKQASQFARIALKDEKIKSFETKKSMIDYEISQLMKISPDKELQELLDESQHQALSELKTHLARLRDVNKEYAKLVLVVSSFYNSLLEHLVPTEMEGYKRVASKNSTFLEARA
jgi:hypothetical protein